MIRRTALALLLCGALALALVRAALVPYTTQSFTNYASVPPGWFTRDVVNNQCSYARTYNSPPSTWTVKQATTTLPGDLYQLGQFSIMGKGYDLTNRGSNQVFGSTTQQRARHLMVTPATAPSGSPLGMAELGISDSAISASSTLNSAAYPAALVSPAGARLDNRDTWWTPAAGDAAPWLQVDLGFDYIVLGFALQGSPAYAEWVTSLSVTSQSAATFSGATWDTVSGSPFAGTTGSNATAFYRFAAPVTARVFRFNPIASTGAASMRVELYGRAVLGDTLGMSPADALALNDTAISASSSYVSYPAVHARWGQQYLGWATASASLNEYLQVDLRRAVSFTGLAVASHKGVDWWVTSFYLITSTDGTAWTTVAYANGTAISFAGPTARETPVLVTLPTAVTARYVRINPRTWVGAMMSLRAQLFGTALASGDSFAPGAFAWTDYSASLQMLSWDKGAQGVAFRYTDPYNFYELKVQAGQLAAVHKTSGLIINVQGPSIATGCSGGGFACLLDDNAATFVTTNADGVPSITIDFRQYVTVSSVAVRVLNTALTNAQITISATQGNPSACGTGVVASVPVGVWTQNCYNQNVRFLTLTVSNIQSISIADIQITGPAVPSTRSLLKRRHGLYTVLDVQSFNVSLQTWYPVTVSATGNVLSYTHGVATTTVTDNSGDPLTTGTIAFTSGQNFESYWDQLTVSFQVTALGTATGIVQPAMTWQYFSATSAAGSPEVLYVTFVRTNPTDATGTFAVYGKAGSPPSETDSAAVNPPLELTSASGTQGTVQVVVPSPGASATYYFGVFTTGNVAVTYSAAAASPTVTALTASLGTSVSGTLSTAQQIDFYKFTPQASYSWTTVTFSVAGTAANQVVVRYRRNGVPTSSVSDQVVTTGITTDGRTTYSVVVTPTTVGDVLYFSVSVNGATAGAPVPVSYRVSANPADPIVASFTPTTSVTEGGGHLVITGSNFDASGTVLLAGQYVCSINTWSATTIDCNIPAGAGGPANVTVTTLRGFFGSNPSFFYNAPTLTSAVIPTNAPPTSLTGPTVGGAILEMTGTQFGPNPRVLLGGRLCVPVSPVSQTQVRCTIPAGEGLQQPLYVAAGNQNTPVRYFDYSLPTLSTVSLTTYASVGGADVFFTGNNFGTSYLILIGPFVCPLKTGPGITNNHTNAACVLPPGAGANLPIKLVSGGQNATVAVTFTYFPPTLTTVQPLTGRTAGGYLLTLTGTNFGPAPLIMVGSVAVCVPVFNNHSYCTCRLLPGEGTQQPITLNAGGVIVQYGQRFDYFPPTLSGAVSPSLIPTAPTNITIYGDNFGANPGPQITIGGLTCTVKSFNGTMAVCESPSGQGTGLTLRVTVAGVAANTITVSYAPPFVTDVVPANGLTAGQVVTVRGGNFGSTQLTGSLKIGGRDCLPVTPADWTHTAVVCNLPPGQGTNNLVRLVVAGQSTDGSTQFFYSYAAPSISGIVPAAVSTDAGVIITINGNNFGLSGIVNVGASTCTYGTAGYTHTQILCTLSAATGTSPAAAVTVDVSGQISNAYAMAYANPSVLSTNPTSASTQGGSLLTIFGSSFGPSGNITIGGVLCQVGGAWPGTSYSSALIVCSVPGGSGPNLPLVVTSVSGLRSAIFTWSYAAPSVTGTTATAKPTVGGTTLTVQGNSFGATGATVTIAGLACPVTAQTHQSIECTLPAGYGLAQNLVVSSGSLTGNPYAFNYDPPVIQSLNPSHGSPAGGYSMTLTGTNFGTIAEVRVAGVVCTVTTQPTNVSPATIVVTVPALSSGNAGATSAQVIVGGQASNPQQFTYDVTPILSFATPTTGPTAGGTVITVLGSNLNEPGSAIRVGGAVCPPVANPAPTNARVVCTVPAGQGAAAPIVADNNGQPSAPLPFAYFAPFIADVQPAHSPTDGTGRVLLIGSNFGTAPTVVIAGAQCALLTRNHTHILCTPPVRYGVNRNVTVNAGGQVSNEFAFNFDLPLVQSVTGCAVNDAAAGTTSGCPNPNSGTTTTITVSGRNFGTATTPISVTVGPYTCGNIVRVTDQTRFTCDLPPGVGALLAVAVTVDGATGSAKLVSYVGPVITAGTVSVDGFPGGTGPFMLNAVGGQVVTFSFTPNRPAGARVAVTFVPGDIACIVADADLAGFLNGNGRCTTAAGGAGRVLGVSYAYNIGTDAAPQMSQSLPSSGGDLVSFPEPVIVAGTIRARFGSPSGATSYVGAIGGDRVTFNVTNIGSNAAVIGVTYQTTGQPVQTCDSVVIEQPGLSLSCVTRSKPFVAPAGPYRFTVTVNQWTTAVGQDTYYFAEPFSITGASGCPLVNGNRTGDCPTEGAGFRLTVNGVNFEGTPGATTVRVGLNDCPNVQVLSPQALSCEVPFGVGTGLPVQVSTAAYTATGVNLVSYAGPSVIDVQGCDEDPLVPHMTVNCDRYGNGTVITIIGTNFGLSGAIVFIANRECTGVVQDSVHPNRRLTCKLPEGAGANQPVTVIQNGGVAGVPGALSYELCPVGTFTVAGAVGDLLCRACEPGSYAESKGAVACKPCPIGTVAPFAHTGVCSTCGLQAVADVNRTSCECPVDTFFPDIAVAGIQAVGNTGDLQCAACPSGADCRASGAKASALQSLPGWWRANTFTLTFIRCLRAQDCGGGLAANADDQCQNNRAGNMCGVCRDDYRMTTGDECIPCPAFEAGSAYLIFLILVLIALVWVQLWIVLRADPVTHQRALEHAVALEVTQAQGPNAGAVVVGAPGGAVEMGKVNSGEGVPSVIPGTGLAQPRFRSAHKRDRTESDLHSMNRPVYGLGGDGKGQVPHFDGYPVAVLKQPNAYFPPGDEGDLYDDARAASTSLQLTVHGPPPPPADFTYKLKIFVVWLQIATKIATGLQIQWPGYYKWWILWFNVINFDFLVLNVSSVECVAGDTDYYGQYVIVMLVPPFLFLLCGLVYLLPNYFNKCCFKDSTREQRARNGFRFVKVWLYLLFFVYAGVSSMTLRHYVCQPIEDKSYLLADLRVECFTDRWERYAIGSLVMLLIYVIGIPAFFAVLLYRKRDSLYKHSQPIVRQELGLLYAGYRKPLWWFELLDMAHRLFLTSILAFFPRPAQMPIGMCWAVLYLIIILRVNPYVRADDDRLHVLGQSQLMMLFIAGNTYAWFGTDVYSYKADVLMSFFLVALTLVFFAVFLLQFLQMLWSIVSEWYANRFPAKAQPATPEGKGKAGVKAKAIGDPQVVVHAPNGNGLPAGAAGTIPIGPGAMAGAGHDAKENTLPFSADGTNVPGVEEDAVKDEIRNALDTDAGKPGDGVALPKRFLLPPLTVKPAPMRPMSAALGPAKGSPAPAAASAGLGPAPAESPAPSSVDNLPTSPLPPIIALQQGTVAPQDTPSTVLPGVAQSQPAAGGVARAPAAVASGQSALMIGGGGAANPSAGVPVPATPNSTNETTITSPVGQLPVVPPTPMN